MMRTILRIAEPMNVNNHLFGGASCRVHLFFSLSPLPIDVMTSAAVDGIKRSNVCGDGYRIEGALLKSYRYSTRESYLPYEDCSMTFKVQSRIHRKTHCIDDALLGASIRSTTSCPHPFTRSERYPWGCQLFGFTAFLQISLYRSKRETSAWWNESHRQCHAFYRLFRIQWNAAKWWKATDSIECHPAALSRHISRS